MCDVLVVHRSPKNYTHVVVIATQVLQRMARTNKRPAPSLKRLQDVAAATTLASQQRKQYSYWHLFSSCRMAVNTLIIVYAWFVSSAVYYGMSFNVTFLEGSTYLNFFLLGLAEIPAIVFVVLVNNWLGRRKTVSLLMMLAGYFIAVRFVPPFSQGVGIIGAFAALALAFVFIKVTDKRRHAEDMNPAVIVSFAQTFAEKG